MKKNGFTLIELLAVIVILAIIALIATPIILGIINDARKESNERSAELYASAVRNAIASYQLTHPNAPIKFSDLDIQYDGEVECAKEELYVDGSFYIAECTVNGSAVDYTYGEQQVTQPNRYYSWSSGSIGGDLPSDAKTTVADLNPGYPFYLGLDVDSDNKVTAVYTCFVRNEIEYCLKGYDTEAFTINTEVLEDAFKDVENACVFDDAGSHCGSDELIAHAYSNGHVDTNKASGVCNTTSDGGFECTLF